MAGPADAGRTGDAGPAADAGRDADRDRDTAGRARNARPRDALGRPLPRGAAGEPVLPDDVTVTPGWAVATAQRLLDDGRPFHAHEVLEAAWKSAAAPERDLWQGLAQLAVGLTHARRGNPSGAVSLLRRGAARLAPYAGTAPHGIGVDAVLAQTAGLAGEIERGGLAGIPPARLRLDLTS